MSAVVNIASRLDEAARRAPERVAVVQHRGRNPDGSYRYETSTFNEFARTTDRLAAGLRGMGVVPGTRLVLFVPFSREFLALTFALFKVGAVVVLIDPGMGRANIFRCLEEVQPEGFIAVPLVHAIRAFKRRKFSRARLNVTVGRRWGWGGTTYRQLVAARAAGETVSTKATDAAAIIYTSGSTGPPKGVVYEHGMFDAQVEMIRDFYGIEPGEIDLPGFPLFGLFNAAMGVTTVIPDMDPTRPAKVRPENIVQHIRDWNVTQAFGSPAFWNRVGLHCESQQITLPTLKRCLSAGGPVPNHVLERMSRVLTCPGAELHTPYGATECLPVASIGSNEALRNTAKLTSEGAGTCVGRPFAGAEIRIIRSMDGPIECLNDAEVLGPGQIGEIVVRSPSATREYDRRPEGTRLAKIPDGGSFWHRMGDVGYFDRDGRLWFCGRKAHVVEAGHGPMYSVCCEAIFNQHPRIYRSALVGLGQRPHQRAAVVVEPLPGEMPKTPDEEKCLREELLQIGANAELTRSICDVLFHPSLPVDTRHNVKINREALAVWAADRISFQ